ncbi:MAG: hypothetical protein HY038_01210, partial [Nitrospirae bacterium]|nr:hypothetical protein [Nitrospirota bacterium]
MASHSIMRGLLIVGLLLALSSLEELVLPMSAIPSKPKKEAKPLVVQPVVPDRPVSSAPLLKGKAKKSAGNKLGENAVVELPGQTPSDRAPLKTRRHHKTGKKLRSPAIVQPKPNLSYHGILEQPQRYDPSRDRRTGRAPNPQAEVLLHDHFQELDKNHDGR